MDKIRYVGPAVLLSAGICLSLACRPRTMPLPPTSSDLLERFLQRAPVTAADKGLELGRSGAWLVTLNDGKKEQRALFKSVRRPRPTLMPDSYTYELAAYELDKLLGLELVPITVERQIDGRSGSLQLFLEGVETEKSRLRKNLQPLDLQAYQDQLEDITLLENLTCTPRQDLGDILIQPDTWRVWRVDFAEAFMPATELQPERLIRRASRKFVNALRNLDKALARRRLARYLNASEMEALFKRLQLILDEIDR
ncbi:MAG: hypothetical protein WCB96_07645, partial [Candidatus Aminicenantales bacterium]